MNRGWRQIDFDIDSVPVLATAREYFYRQDRVYCKNERYYTKYLGRIGGNVRMGII